MSKIEQYSRILHHRLTGQGAQFTVPTSNDHTDETWQASDLYIGEIGMNVTDDKIYFRSNNGIIEIGTSGTASGSDTLWAYASNSIQIGATYSPDAIIRNANSFVDLGSSSLRFKDLYLGGSSDGFSIINVNAGLNLRNANDNLITTIVGGNDKAPITMSTQSSIGNKTIGLHLNSENTEVSGTGANKTSISTNGAFIEDSTAVTVLSGLDVTVKNSNNVTYVGQGRERDYERSDSLAVGGEFVIRGVEDDLTGCYDESDLVKGQARLTTTDALTTNIFTRNWSTKSVIQCKAKVLGMAINDPALIYSAEIFTTAWTDTIDGFIVNTPIINETETFSTGGDIIELLAYADDTEFSLKVKGASSLTIQWLINYEYQVILNTN